MIELMSGATNYFSAILIECLIVPVEAIIFVFVFNLALRLAPPRIERDAGNPIRLDLK